MKRNFQLGDMSSEWSGLSRSVQEVPTKSLGVCSVEFLDNKLDTWCDMSDACWKSPRAQKGTAWFLTCPVLLINGKTILLKKQRCTILSRRDMECETNKYMSYVYCYNWFWIVKEPNNLKMSTWFLKCP